MKISHDSFKISEGDLHKYLELRTLLRSPDNAKIAEINGGIDICGERSKIRFKTLFPFVKLYSKVDQKLLNLAKNMLVLAGRRV